MCNRDAGLNAHTQRVMNLSLSPATTPCPPGRRTQAVRPSCGLGALLFVEGLVLSVLFDPTPYFGNHRWWATLLAQGPRLLGRLVIVTLVATPLIGGQTLRDAFRRASGRDGRHSVWTSFWRTWRPSRASPH